MDRLAGMLKQQLQPPSTARPMCERSRATSRANPYHTGLPRYPTRGTRPGLATENTLLIGPRATGFAGSSGAGGYPHHDDDDLRGVAEQASKHAGDSGDSDLFATIVRAVGNKRHSLASEDIDEGDAVQQHRHVYDCGSGQQADDHSLGSAAALQALEMMIGDQAAGSSATSGTQNSYVAIAMAEAIKLFDQKASQGELSSGTSKEAAVQKAAETALKLYMKSGGSQGASASGGMNLMGLQA
ncbi:hypothetical protein Micbo1qcDRAFT_237561 [Microdochium bolleyi]|uniref:DUF7721 domain-containing protein n=1 Tax=Microdochium bolleyi TaxID=196109 RepID=A0A136IJN7_9PEZI|nr:hypothetical protein Micbo1qcDRAFT_237561 [Microdochium bolleyi]